MNLNPATLKSAIIALAGAAAGGVVGYHVFFWVMKYSFYPMILPGALIGFGASFGRTRILLIPVLCALAALGLSLYLEWRTRPFTTDPSWNYFISHFRLLTPVTWIMIGLGTFLAFWLPFRSRSRLY